MTNPVVVEVLRGERVEFAHRGAGAVVDADGRAVFAFGDIERPVYPRSAVKALQALPLIESGAADRLGLERQGDRARLRLAFRRRASMSRWRARCSPRPDATTARSNAARTGRSAKRPPARSPVRADSPSALHNNCSGKHAGFVCLACAAGVGAEGLCRAGSPGAARGRRRRSPDVTRRGSTRRRAASTAARSRPTPFPCGRWRSGFARFATGRGLAPERARGGGADPRRGRRASGAGRRSRDGSTPRSMTILGARAFTKTGAEGVFCAALPELGLGIAVKADDGGARAAQVMIAALLGRFGGFDDDAARRLAPFVAPRLDELERGRDRRPAAGRPADGRLASRRVLTTSRLSGMTLCHIAYTISSCRPVQRAPHRSAILARPAKDLRRTSRRPRRVEPLHFLGT